jgi:hypothetical protein
VWPWSPRRSAHRCGTDSAALCGYGQRCCLVPLAPYRGSRGCDRLGHEGPSGAILSGCLAISLRMLGGPSLVKPF